MNPTELSVSFPMTITVRLGAESTAPSAVAASAAPEPAVATSAATQPAFEAARPRSYYDGYIGYKADFLDREVQLPELTEEQRRNAAKNSDAAAGADATVLPYTHFSVVMNRRRQLAYYTAVNIDGAQSSDLNRGRDKWFYDSRIAESEQIGESLYARNALDRGHLVRRLDPVWGANAERANDDTFHFTNCSPQHERFNQGQDLWQGLENYILNNADALNRKVSVFTGPVMDEEDPIYKGVRLPLAFFKILLYVKNDQLCAAAYILEQAKLVQDMLRFEAAFDPGVFRVKLDEIRERTGLNFSYLSDAELPLSASGLEAGQERIAVSADYANLVL